MRYSAQNPPIPPLPPPEKNASYKIPKNGGGGGSWRGPFSRSTFTLPVKMKTAQCRRRTLENAKVKHSAQTLQSLVQPMLMVLGLAGGKVI